MRRKALTIQEASCEVRRILRLFPTDKLSGAVAIAALQILNTFVSDCPKKMASRPFTGRGIDLDLDLDLDELKKHAEMEEPVPEYSPKEEEPVKYEVKYPPGKNPVNYDDVPF